MPVSVRVVALAGLLALAHTSAQAQTPKRGGVLTLLPLTVPSSLSPHEESTMSTLTVAAPCFNNLVTFDSRKSQESVESVVPELAERWAWQDGGRALVFFLRKGVRWHDGQPFTAKDVKYTFDMVRGAPEAEGKLRISPRQDWYANVTAVEVIDPHTDDPDANFYQNYKCGSPRNYTDYCSPEVDRLIDEQSQATDPAKRLKLVRDLERRLQLDGARVIVGWPTRYVVHWPHVKGWIPSASMHNHNRMQDVWLDK